MPYRDKEQKVEALKEWRKKRHEVPSEVPLPVEVPTEVPERPLASGVEVPMKSLPEKVKSLEVPKGLQVRAETDPQWAHIKEYISRPTPKMPSLERLQIQRDLTYCQGVVYCSR